MKSTALLHLLACASPPPAPLAPGAPVWVEAASVDAGAPVVLHAPSATLLPAVEGLTAEKVRVGDDGTSTWELRGEPGSYVIEVPATDGSPTALFVDIGAVGPDAALEAPVAPTAAASPVTAGMALVVVAVAVLAVVAVLAWRRFAPAARPQVADPPDIRARKAWATLRSRRDLTSEALAQGLSDVYRDYLEAVHPFPARARTTREITDNLAGVYTFAQLERARRLLGAMDLVKFSDHADQAAVLEGLDADFDALVVAPARMTPPTVEEEA